MTTRDPRPDRPTPLSTGLSVEARIRREQLRIVERTSLPGLVGASLGGVALLALAFQPGYESARMALLGICVCIAIMSALWGGTIRACRRDDLVPALLFQLIANQMGTILFFVFIDRGAVLAVFTSMVPVISGAMVFDDRTQRRVTAIGITVLIGAAAVAEVRIVEPLVLPNVILYASVAVTIVLGLWTPISSLRLFNQHLASSRSDAMRNEKLACDERDRADAQSRDLENVSAELRELMYVVSHDLRAPLINIDGFSHLLKEVLEGFDENVRQLDPDDPTAKSWAEAQDEVNESLHFISSGTKKMDALIKGLLELSRIDRGPIQNENVPLPELVNELVGAMQHQIRERDVTLEVGPLPEISGERLRISQVFGNLIDNAVKYMPEREPRMISVSCDERDKEFVFSVCDTGLGIDVAGRDKIFRLFQRLTAPNAAAGEGIGLAAVKKIIERHGGHIWVEDGANGVGANFRFTWPRHPRIEGDQAVEESVAA